MGGTSTDVARFDGQFEYEYETVKAGVRLVAPTLAIETVAAGGGSICAFDGVKLVVGPASAGADPGPACYGRGGPLCVTDLNLFLGRMAAERLPFPPDRAAVERRLAELGAEVAPATGEKLSPTELAEGLLRIANANMARAIRNVTVAKGFDPAEYLLVAFGGAAPQHACAVARELGIREILVHPDASIFSARGIGLADVTHHAVEGIYRLADELTVAELPEVFARLAAKAVGKLVEEGFCDQQPIEQRRSLDVRYQGADVTLSVPWSEDAEWEREFERLHRRQYGYVHPGRAVEVAAARVEAVVRTLRGEDSAIDRESLTGGTVVQGPALIAEAMTTIAVDAGWTAEALPRGELLLMDGGGAPEGRAAAPQSVMLEIFNNLLAGVAERMGHVLRRTAMSVNVKERLDYSCAVFTAAGELVASAAHIPVHLGAMGATVRAVMADNPDLRAGDVIVSNDPYRGGSHLPDVTVVLPVHDAATGRLAFFTACRAHHAELGGARPGSMPPHSRRLGEEGVVIRNFFLVRGGQSREAELRELLTAGRFPTRAVEENMADLRAQVAAVQQGAADLRALVEQHSLAGVEKQMQAILAASEIKVRRGLAKLPAGVREFVDYLETANGNSVPIRVRVELTSDDDDKRLRGHLGGSRSDSRRPAAIFDFTGTGGVVDGNLNANPAIVNAAVLYVLRLLVNEDIPLNEGALRAVRIMLPESLLNPPAGLTPEESPAVAAGNVETSQRVVDVLLGALGIAAASQGTMNNVLFGAETFGFYETVCGGAGATAEGPGADAVQVHMTNTRSTDPEVLERRLPVRLWEFSVRHGSGGAGRRRGGNGAVRRIEFLAPLELSLITQRRGKHPPFGLMGGGSGALGENLLRRRDGTVECLPGIAERTVAPGDMLEVRTPGGGGFGAAK
jgi:5-oxoprolinase (ATP-hydrolysing)